MNILLCHLLLYAEKKICLACAIIVSCRCTLISLSAISDTIAACEVRAPLLLSYIEERQASIQVTYS